MLAQLKIEAIGDSTDAQIKAYHKTVSTMLGRNFADAFIGKSAPSYWVARITGTDIRYGYQREFLHGKKDYTNANSIGSRGVEVSYLLESGNIYEVKKHVSWKRSVRYFCTVDDNGDIIDMSKEEVDQCLQKP